MYQVNINARCIHLNILFKTFGILLAFCYIFTIINLFIINLDEIKNNFLRYQENSDRL